jgi:hypothetical protein
VCALSTHDTRPDRYADEAKAARDEMLYALADVDDEIGEAMVNETAEVRVTCVLAVLTHAHAHQNSPSQWSRSTRLCDV